MADFDKVKAFISKWRGSKLKERAGAQEHFIDICNLVGHKTPAEADPKGEWFTFETHVDKEGGGRGFADAWYKGKFGWEYKGPDKDLDAAYNQLLQYRESLENPPLLVVSDYTHFEIHTNFTGTAKRTYSFNIEDLEQPSILKQLSDLFHDPDELSPDLKSDKLTEQAAERFADLADSLRKRYPPKKVAHFLTQCVFCFFAEDIGLLPRSREKRGIFTELIEQSQADRYRHFPRYARDLFHAMAKGGDVQYQQIAHFNGGLFTTENGDVPDMTVKELEILGGAAGVDWSSVEPSIFGTLFERGLDPAKRSQLGAHYTSREDIEAIVEPVLMSPFRREWESICDSFPPLQGGDVPKEQGGSNLQSIRDSFLKKLGAVTILDPACGSGNFLYVALGLLKDLEKTVIMHPAFDGLPKPAPTFVSPEQLFGIELSAYAHELANVVVWIGYIQWFRQNGYPYDMRPILQKLDNIQNKDAILGKREDGTLYKPDWPSADVIVGNPPFLGGNKVRSELGDETVERLFELYEKVPNFSDLVCYWFERAREQIANGKVKRAGLIATQAIRGGVNRDVLRRIKDDGDIFLAHSDRKWVLDGAAVRVSIVGFDNGNEQTRFLDNQPVKTINADLTTGANLTTATRLTENQNISHMGTKKGAAFDLSPDEAKKMLDAPLNPNGKPNSDVVKKWRNGLDITRRSRNYWVIDFGIDMIEEEAALYEMPFEYAKEHVASKYKDKRSRWWIHERTRPDMRNAFKSKSRYIALPRVAKHMVFVWLATDITPDSQLIVFARDDDYFFGVLHSRLHELWSLRQGTQLREKSSGNRYTPTTTFETFPFPYVPGQEPTADSKVKAIAAAAKELDQMRNNWLNPEKTPNQEEVSYQKELKKRTLTKLYNTPPTWLDNLHEKLDRAVCAAYGWDDYETLITDDEEILRRLLALNLERAGG